MYIIDMLCWQRRRVLVSAIGDWLVLAEAQEFCYCYIYNRYALLAEAQGFSYCCRGLVGAIGNCLLLAEAQGFSYCYIYNRYALLYS
jgi:hypothetical protein